jgi:hypothetical protein
MERTCEDCGGKFEGRLDARFCSEGCRKKFGRRPVIADRGEDIADIKADTSEVIADKSVRDKIKSDISVRDNVRDNLEDVRDKCPGCLKREEHILALEGYVGELEQKIKDWDVRTMIIRGHISAAEKRAERAEKELGDYRRGGKPQSFKGELYPRGVS